MNCDTQKKVYIFDDIQMEFQYYYYPIEHSENSFQKLLHKSHKSSKVVMGFFVVVKFVGINDSELL